MTGGVHRRTIDARSTTDLKLCGDLSFKTTERRREPPLHPEGVIAKRCQRDHPQRGRLESERMLSSSQTDSTMPK
jgi:hypothetical protein